MENKSAQIFNAAIVAAAVSALNELGFFDALKDQHKVEIEDFCQNNSLHPMSFNALINSLAYMDIVEWDEEEKIVIQGATFTQFYKDKGYFLWLVRGYGHMLQNLASITYNKSRTGDFTRRDGKYIAMAGRDYGAQYVDSHFEDALVKEPFKAAADIGCGSAERLINLVNRNPDLHAVGIELNEDAVNLARKSVASAQLEDRISIIQSDVTSLSPLSELSQIDLLFSFFMAHDLWPRDNCLKALQNIRTVFPNATRFLLCDTYRSGLSPTEERPIFTLGFEITHAVMGQYIPTSAEWLELFEEAGWECVAQQEIGIPNSAIFDLRPM